MLRLDPLAAKHPFDLRLFEVGDDIDRSPHRHDGHQPLRRLDVGALAYRAIPDRTVGRGGDCRIAEVEPRRLDPRFVDVHLRLVGGDGCLVGIELLLSDRQVVFDDRGVAAEVALRVTEVRLVLS